MVGNLWAVMQQSTGACILLLVMFTWAVKCEMGEILTGELHQSHGAICVLAHTAVLNTVVW